MQINNINFTSAIKSYETSNMNKEKIKDDESKKKNQKNQLKKKRKFASDDGGKNIDIII